MNRELKSAPLFTHSETLRAEQAETLNAYLETCLEEGILGMVESQSVAYLARLTGECRPEVVLACALALRAPRFGHVCLDLSRPFATFEEDPEQRDASIDPSELIVLPELSEWRTLLASSPLVTTHPHATDHPFILRDGLLYTQRYYVYESKLSELLLARAGREPIKLEMADIFPDLFRGLFSDEDGVAGRQTLSAALSLIKPLSVISGGPGMGKTYTVRAILFLQLVAHHLGNKQTPFKAALIAPSGKAAARLRESLFKDFGEFQATCKNLIKEKPELSGLDVGQFFEAQITYSTIHRLLGFQPQFPTRFFHDADNPLPYDLVVVDESSMVDLPLMTKTLAALHPKARVLLLGDAYQLASVAAGSVLSDIAGPTHAGELTLSDPLTTELAALTGLGVESCPLIKHRSPLHDAVIHYNQNYRFSAESGIGNFAKDCLALYNATSSNADALVAGLQTQESTDLNLEPLTEGDLISPALQAKIVDQYTSYLEILLRPSDDHASTHVRYSAALKAFEDFRVLTPHRRGPLGVEDLNTTIEVFLERALGEHLGFRTSQLHYRGRPILIRQNDYETGLFNGDIGIVVDKHMAAFPDAEEGIRLVALARLPRHETVFAMTVHSSQGSEFRDVLFMLPSKISPVVTRELLYTGVTRGRERVTLAGPSQVLREGLETTVDRISGLRTRLWSV